MCHLPPTNNLTKSQNFEAKVSPRATRRFFKNSFFFKGAPKAKKLNFKLICPESKRAPKIGYKTFATCPQRRFLKKTLNFEFFKKGPQRQKELKF